MQRGGLIFIVITCLLVNHVYGHDVLRVVLGSAILVMLALRWIFRMLSMVVMVISFYFHSE